MEREDKVKLMYSTPKDKSVKGTYGRSAKAHLEKISGQIQEERTKRMEVEKELRDLMIQNEPYNGLWASTQ